jgi:hypothetical protein
MSIFFNHRVSQRFAQSNTEFVQITEIVTNQCNYFDFSEQMKKWF